MKRCPIHAPSWRTASRSLFPKNKAEGERERFRGAGEVRSRCPDFKPANCPCSRAPSCTLLRSPTTGSWHPETTSLTQSLNYTAAPPPSAQNFTPPHVTRQKPTSERADETGASPVPLWSSSFSAAPRNNKQYYTRAQRFGECARKRKDW